MHEITIVKRRTRVWPIVLALLVLALIIVAALWLTGYIDVRQTGVTFDVLLLQPASPPGT